MARLIDADALKHEIIWSIPMMPTVRISIEHKIDAALTIPAIPVEWLREKMQKPQTTCVNPFGFVLDEWLEEQDAR